MGNNISVDDVKKIAVTNPLQRTTQSRENSTRKVNEH